jgi:hypothetical protein
MSLTVALSLGFILFFFIGMIVFGVLERRRSGYQLRLIPAFARLNRAIGLSVEDGSRIHLSIGRGSLTGTESAAAFTGLSMLECITRRIGVSDRPPVVTSGDGALSILSRDALKTAYKAIEEETQYDPNDGRLSGITPFSYVAGTLPLIFDEQVSANVMVGHFGGEVALLTDAGERSGSLTLGGTDSLSGQAVLYATAQEPLIGEELYAGGAYLRAGGMHIASLRVQDVFRWILVLVILLGSIAKLAGVL